MNARVCKTAVGVLAGTLCAVSVALSASPQKPSGSIVGLVSDSAGVPQMGASVLLYDRFDRMVQRVLTSDKGTFGFAALAPDIYSLRVSLASFLPAIKRDISVQPGMQSLLNVSLASVFSSVELVGVTPGQTSLMSDEWRWVLRSSSATRPVLRALPKTRGSQQQKSAAVFSDTRGVVRVSAGDQMDLGGQPDLGTAFAFATSLFGNNQLQVSGNFGSSSGGVPATAIRTSFRRLESIGPSSPEVKLTMRQLALGPRSATALPEGMQGANVPVLRSVSATMLDAAQITDSIRFEYGMSVDSVTFYDRLNYISPFGRVTYNPGRGGVLQFGYASGTPPAEAFAGDAETGLEFQQDLESLAMFPRVSLRSGVARVQRTQSFEIGYRRRVGSRTFGLGAYDDRVSNAAITLVGGNGFEAGPDLLPDLFTNSWTLNAGGFHSRGYVASVTQSLGHSFDVMVAYGSGNALLLNRGAVGTGTPDELRHAIQRGRRYSLTTQLSGRMPKTGTQLIASYRWSNVDPLNAAHMFLTQRVREGLGLNVRVTQPIPYLSGLPGRVEANAEMRNLLAQGYTPFDIGEHRLYLLQNPRTVRGGLSFIF